MLVLTRSVGQAVILSVAGLKIRVALITDSSGALALGIDAPRSVSIRREELPP